MQYIIIPVMGLTVAVSGQLVDVGTENPWPGNRTLVRSFKEILAYGNSSCLFRIERFVSLFSALRYLKKYV